MQQSGAILVSSDFGSHVKGATGQFSSQYVLKPAAVKKVLLGPSVATMVRMSKATKPSVFAHADDKLRQIGNPKTAKHRIFHAYKEKHSVIKQHKEVRNSFCDLRHSLP